MGIVRSIAAALALTILSAGLATAQQPERVNAARERARVPYEEGLAHLRLEAFDAAVRAFKQAIDIDAGFDMAHYMLGRTYMMQKQYVSAVYALNSARSIYLSEANRQFSSKEEGQRHRRDRITELEELIQELKARQPQTYQIREQIRQLEERKRQVEDMDRAHDTNPATLVPAFVSLSLGSAYFRSDNLADAEKAYREAIAADPKVGEAYSNLAVVYMETGRLAEAEKAVQAAEKTGFKVAPALKAEIAKRKSGT